MKLGMNFIKSFTAIEVILFVVFVIYLMFPIMTPDSISELINSPFGMIVILIVSVYLFLYMNPCLAILYVFVAYDLIRRSSQQSNGHIIRNSGSPAVSYVQYTPSQGKKETEMRDMNPPTILSLEEEIVKTMAPVGHSDKNQYVETSFKPVTNDLHNALRV